jgi:hypothetical protein
MQVEKRLQRLANGLPVEPLNRHYFGKRFSDIKPLYRLQLPEGLFLDATESAMALALKGGLLDQVNSAIAEARERGMHFLPGRWLGREALYPTVKDGVGVLTEKLFFRPKSLKANDENTKKLAQLALEGSKVEPGYELVSSTWKRKGAMYKWRKTDKTLVVASISDLRLKSRSITLMRAKWGPWTGRNDHSFIWTLPDGSKVDATWPQMKTAIEKVLRPHGKNVRVSAEGEVPRFLEVGFSIKVRNALIKGAG